MDTKTALLDAAENAARAHGHDGFSFGDLSKTVGIRKASIHHHFPTKADLLLALMVRYRESIFTHLETLNAQPKASDRLKEYINLYRTALCGGNSLCLCIALSVGRDGLSEEAKQQLTLFRAGVINWLEHVFKTAQTDGSITGVNLPHAEAIACQSLIEGAQLRARTEHDMNKFEEAVALLIGRCS